MTNEQKNFNVNVDAKLSDVFSEQAEQRGYTKYRAVEGALRAFIVLPPELQVKLIAGTDKDLYTTLVQGLVDAEIQKHLARLVPAKEKLLSLLKQAAKPSNKR